MATDSPQRSYRAPCPGCGAPVEFRSAQSIHAVCAYCHSTVLRSGDSLSRIGKMAELFDDFSPLQLLASGVWQVDGKSLAFTLVGRLQYKYAEGSWTEWHAVFADGGSAYLSEDNGAFVMALPLATTTPLPDAAQYPVGSPVNFDGRAFSVASNQQVVLLAAVGELPHLPPTGQAFAMVELRSGGDAGPGTDDTVLSIDYGTQPPTLSVGRSVRLEDLQLTGLRDESSKEEVGRQFACPQCGAPVEAKLASSKSIKIGRASCRERV